MRSGYFLINRWLQRERGREQESEREGGYVHLWKQWKHRNSTISVIWDLDISLSIGDCIEREAMSISEMVKTWKWYYLHNMRSGYFLINRWLQREREGESKRVRERGAMSICETVKTQKLYYLRNMRSWYFPINRRLHRERGYVHLWNGENMEMVPSP